MSPAYPSTCTFTSTLIACPLGTQPYPRTRLQAEPPHQEGLPWINVTGWSISDQKGPQRTQQHWKSTARNAPLALSISLGLRTHIFSDLLILPHAGCCSWSPLYHTRPTSLYSCVCCLPSTCTVSPSKAQMPHWSLLLCIILLFKNCICLFGHAGSSLLRGLFSSVSEWGPLSRCGARASLVSVVTAHELSGCGTQD